MDEVCGLLRVWTYVHTYILTVADETTGLYVQYVCVCERVFMLYECTVLYCLYVHARTYVCILVCAGEVSEEAASPAALI